MKKQETVICIGCWRKAGSHEKIAETNDGPMHIRCAKKAGIEIKKWDFANKLNGKYPNFAATF